MEVKIDADELCRLRKTGSGAIGELEASISARDKHITALEKDLISAIEKNSCLNKEVSLLTSKLKRPGGFRAGGFLFATESAAIRALEASIAAKDDRIAIQDDQITILKGESDILSCKLTATKFDLKQARGLDVRDIRRISVLMYDLLDQAERLRL